MVSKMNNYESEPFGFKLNIYLLKGISRGYDRSYPCPVKKYCISI